MKRAVTAAYTKPVRFSKLLRDIRRESRVTKLSPDVKRALRAVVNVRAGSTLSYNWSDAEARRIDVELDRFGAPSHGGKL